MPGVKRKAARSLRASGSTSAIMVIASMVGAASASGGSLHEAHPFAGLPYVGALYSNTKASGDHSCTASVVHSGARDLIITAAHCINGDATKYSFAPQYFEGSTPHGVWHVQRAYVDPRWKSGQNPRYDYAVLSVAPQKVHGKTQRLEDVTGAARLGGAPRVGSAVQVVAYNSGQDDPPLTCTTKALRSGGFPVFQCSNYVSGSSGSPWIQTGLHGHGQVISGIIGGRLQGGCTDHASYSSPLTVDAQVLLARAAAGGPGDDVPAPGGDGCL